MRGLKVAVGLVSFWAAWLAAPATARAQDVVITQAPASNALNYAVCANAETLDFTVAASNWATDDTFQVWVGPPTSTGILSCVAPASRQSGGGCWPLAPTVANAGIKSSMSFSVRAQDIAFYLDNASPPLTYGGAGGIKATVDSSPSPCTQQKTPGPVALGIYFFLVKPDGTVDGDFAAQQGGAEYKALEAATLGPNAPSDVSLVVNDGYVTLSWTPSGDPSIVGYNIYCRDYGQLDAATPSLTMESGTAETGGNIYDAGVSGGTCGTFPSADIFTVAATATTTDSGTAAKDSGLTDSAADTTGVAGETGATTATTPAGISEIPLGAVGGTVISLCAAADGGSTAGAGASSATITLKNDDFYAFAVAAVDSVGNVGPVASPLVCGTPSPLKDFWFDYTSDGGGGGGGYCALEGVGLPAGGAGMGVGIGLALIGLSRRRLSRGAVLSQGMQRPGPRRSRPPR